MPLVKLWNVIYIYHTSFDYACLCCFLFLLGCWVVVLLYACFLFLWSWTCCFACNDRICHLTCSLSPVCRLIYWLESHSTTDLKPVFHGKICDFGEYVWVLWNIDCSYLFGILMMIYYHPALLADHILLCANISSRKIKSLLVGQICSILDYKTWRKKEKTLSKYDSPLSTSIKGC